MYVTVVDSSRNKKVTCECQLATSQQQIYIYFPNNRHMRSYVLKSSFIRKLIIINVNKLNRLVSRDFSCSFEQFFLSDYFDVSNLIKAEYIFFALLKSCQNE